MKKFKFIYLNLVIILLFTILTGCSYINNAMKTMQKGLTVEEQATIDKTTTEYIDKIKNKTWYSDESNFHWRFNEDGSVEEDGILSEPNNWILKFGNEYDTTTPLSEYSRKAIEETSDYYIHFKSPIYENKQYHLKVKFSDTDNLILGSTPYIVGIDYIHEVPEDTILDPYFYTPYAWGDTGEDGLVGIYWVLQDDGLGAETTGALFGEMIYPSTFYWSIKDNYLYIDWTSLNEEDGTENHYKLDVYEFEKLDDNSFNVWPYMDYKKENVTHFVATDSIDISDF